MTSHSTAKPFSLVLRHWTRFYAVLALLLCLLLSAGASAQTAVTFLGSIAGNVLTVNTITSGSGIATGMIVSGSGVATNTSIVALGTGTGGTGTYFVSVTQAISGPVQMQAISQGANTTSNFIGNSPAPSQPGTSNDGFAYVQQQTTGLYSMTKLPLSGVVTGTANPATVAGPTVNNGTATTAMRSDATPAIQLGSSSQAGLLQCGSGVLCPGGVISANENGANPTSTAGPTANNGVLTTYMRSDATPAIQLGSNSQAGLLECGTGISCSGGTASIGLQTTGSVSTLAFPGSAETYTYPSTSKTLAASDLSNATLPAARNNIGVGPYISITDPAYGASAAAADNATAIQAAINAAVAAGVSLYIPPSATCFKYTAPLTISGNLSVVGSYAVANYGNNINIPPSSPYISGSVLCPSSNGSDAIDISGSSLDVQFTNIGIVFQTPFSGTGDGIHYVPTTTQGLAGATWSNVMVYGHDGNHYAYNLANAIYNNYYSLYGWGGGGLNLSGNGITGNYGNSTFYTPQFQVVVGGTANGITLSATALDALNLINFLHPQVGLVNQVGVTPVGNPPTSAQYTWTMDGNETFIQTTHLTLGGNISGAQGLFTGGANQNSFDFNSGNLAIGINSPAWTTLGIALPSGNSATYNDTTSTGTVAIVGISAMNRGTMTATNAITVTHLASLYLPVPVAGTNVTATANHSLYAAGEIFTASDIVSSAGATISGGNVTINHNDTHTVSIGAGSTTGSVTIGGGSNTTTLASSSVTVSGNAAVTGTTLPTQAAGTLGVGGAASNPTTSTNGEGDVFLVSTTGGVGIQGKGSTSDFTVFDSAGSAALTVPTGTTNIKVAGSITATLSAASGANQVCTGSAGTAFTTVASGTACASSAMRFKDPKELLDLTKAPQRIMDLRPAVWVYKDTSEYGAQPYVGLYADDVAKMDPRCVTRDKHGKLLNYYDRCVLAYLTATVQAQQREIAALRARR